jgi:hypothetical protein
MQSLKKRIKNQELTLRMVTGTKQDLADEFYAAAREFGLTSAMNKDLFIDSYKDRPSYFREFSKTLRKTDILWTKPSEMSFYTGTGIPIIMAPSIGSQEQFNRIWLKTVGGGVAQADPRYVDEWLFDWINSGGLARMAWNGYIEAPTHGAYRIESITTGEKIELEQLPMIV